MADTGTTKTRGVNLDANPNDPVALAVRKLLSEAKMTQAAMATAIGLQQQYVGRFANGVQRPTLEQLRAMERAAGVPIGHCLRIAGFVSDVPDIEAALLTDKVLDDAARNLLAETYRYAKATAAVKAPPAKKKR